MVEALRALSEPTWDEPSAVLLSPGTDDPLYSEHSFLSRRMDRARAEAMIHAIEANNFALSEYRRWRERRGRERAKQRDRAHAEKCATLPGRFRKREPKGPLPPPTPRDFLIEGVYLRLMTVALSRVEALVAEEKASRG